LSFEPEIDFKALISGHSTKADWQCNISAIQLKLTA
jgi:hypothetical protein